MSLDQAQSAAKEADTLARWQTLAARFNFADFLNPQDGFRKCDGTSEPWTSKDQPGIYFYLADDGQGYIGQSIVPQSRLRQHLREQGDVVKACFKPCPERDLDRVEAELISQLEAHIPLRNIKLAVSTSREVPFDELINPAERERFLAGSELSQGAWKDFPQLVRIQASKFAKFQQRDGGPEALAAARLFIQRAIPKPAETEASFWSVTLFPRTCFLRINVGQQEVFTAQGRAGGCDVRVFSDKRISLFRSSKARYQVPSYETGFAASALEKWLVRDALKSCRRLVVRLMRHTTTLNSGSHCPQVVRAP